MKYRAWGIVFLLCAGKKRSFNRECGFAPNAILLYQPDGSRTIARNSNMEVVDHEAVKYLPALSTGGSGNPARLKLPDDCGFLRKNVRKLSAVAQRRNKIREPGLHGG